MYDKVYIEICNDIYVW